MKRSFIEYVAGLVASELGIATPTFTRFVRRGGFAKQHYYGKDGEFFTLPHWLADEATFYQMAYIAHEVCHHAKFTCHDETFYSNERKALALFDLEPVYVNGYRYVQGLNVLGTNVPVWTKAQSITFRWSRSLGARLSYGEGR